MSSSTQLKPWYLTDRCVPISVDVSFFGSRYVDSLSWNLNDVALAPSQYASQTCADLVSHFINDFCCCYIMLPLQFTYTFRSFHSSLILILESPERLPSSHGITSK